jgi:antitoxin ParD1/3/4
MRFHLDNFRTSQHHPITKLAHFLLSPILHPEQECVDMNVSLGERWEKFVETTVQTGRYGSASEVVREGLRLVEEREVKLRALRETLDASLAQGGSVSDGEMEVALAAEAARLQQSAR